MRFQVMDQTGHSTLDFDTADPAMLAAASEKFDQLVKGEKKTAFRKTAGSGELIRAFDPTAETILFRSPLQGG